MRSARVVLATAVAFAPAAVAALPARADECVRVAVDYGTLAGAPAGPNTTCVSSSGTAAEVLAARSRALGTAPPRYRGNFLCAIDGYPGDNACGDHGTEPYWSFWLWVDGRWTYSSIGVDTYTVRDADKDGHPDPMGFRYHEFSKRQAPRANPSYPKPTTPPAPRPSATRSAAPGVTTPATTRPPATGGTAAAPSTSGASPAPVASSPAGTAPAGATATATSAVTATLVAGESPGTDGVAGVGGAAPPRPEAAAFPFGLVVGGAVALGLIGAAAVKMRGTP